MAISVGMLALAACDGSPPAPQTAVAPAPPVVDEFTATPNSGRSPVAMASSAPEVEQEIPTATPAQRVILEVEWGPGFEYLEDMEEYADFVGHYPSQRNSHIQLRIIDDWSRSKIGSDNILVMQFGGSPTYFDEDDPPYFVGEEYMLFLRRHRERRGEVNPKFTNPPRYSVLAPQGRYRIHDDRVESVSGYTVKNGLDGHSVREAKSLVSAAQTICWQEGAKVATSVTPGAQEFESVQAMERTADAIVLVAVEGVAEGRVEEGAPSSATVHFTDVHLRVVEDWSSQKLTSDRLVVGAKGRDVNNLSAGGPALLRGRGVPAVSAPTA